MISYNQLYKSSLTGGKEVVAPHVFYSCTRDHCPYKVDYSSEPTRVDQEIVRFVRRFV